MELIVSVSLTERFGSRCHADRMTDLSPEMGPIQYASRPGKMLDLFGLDPVGAISNHHHRACRLLADHSRCRLGLLTNQLGWTKGGHIPSLGQAMPLSRWTSGTSSVAPRKRRGAGRHRQILYVATDDCHFSFHPSSLFSAPHPASIDADLLPDVFLEQPSPRDTQRDESKQTIRGATTCS